MSMEIRTVEGVQIIKPTPTRLTAVSGADEFRDTLRQTIEDGNIAIAIDLATVEYADSTAIGALIDAYKRLARFGGTLCLFSVGVDIREFFRQTVLDQFIEIVPDESMALTIMTDVAKKKKKGILGMFS